MKLTDKDILLVKLAVSILIVFFMVRFLIMPGIGRYQENRIEGKELEDRVEEIQTAVDSIQVIGRRPNSEPRGRRLGQGI